MDNSEVGKRIRLAREEAKLNKKELALRIQVAASTIQRYEDGTINKLKIPIIESIAKVLNVNPLWIIGNSDQKHATPQSPFESISIEEKFRIPVLGEVAAGQPIFAEENYIGHEEISEELAATGTFFGLRIKGDSMSPRIAEGDTVIVRQQDDAESGDIVIVLINGDTATCKRLMKYQEGISLISFNPAYAPMTFSNAEIEEKPIKIIGKVVENRQKW